VCRRPTDRQCNPHVDTLTRHRTYREHTIEHCDIVVGWGGTLSACPSFDLHAVTYTSLAIGGTQYGTGQCPQGARMAAGSTITWDVIGGRSNSDQTWEICF
jgi:hypothetical protein